MGQAVSQAVGWHMLAQVSKQWADTCRVLVGQQGHHAADTELLQGPRRGLVAACDGPWLQSMAPHPPQQALLKKRSRS